MAVNINSKATQKQINYIKSLLIKSDYILIVEDQSISFSDASNIIGFLCNKGIRYNVVKNFLRKKGPYIPELGDNIYEDIVA